MPDAAKVDNNYQVYRIKDFSGGWSSRPQVDSEAQAFVNLEVTREKYARTILGSRHFNDTDISVGGTAVLAALGSGSAGVLGSGGYEYCLFAATDLGARKIWVATSRAVPATMTDITGAAALTSYYWVFQQFVDSATGAGVMLMANSFDGLYAWDGTGNIVEVMTAPSNIEMLASYQGHVFAVVLPNQIYYSDYLDYTSWPGDNLLEVSMEKGPITGVASLPGKLVIFFSNGWATITAEDEADFADSFQIAGATGTIYPGTLSCHGSEIAFLTASGPVILDATGTKTEFIAEATRGFWTENIPSSGTDRWEWRGHLSAFYYTLIHRERNVMYLYDRRAQAWSKIYFPDDIIPYSMHWIDYYVDNSPPTNLTTYPTAGVLCGSEDGYINLLYLSGLTGGGRGDDDNATWVNTDQVLSVWRSRELDLGSFNTVKSIRRLLLSVRGENIVVDIFYRKSDGSIEHEQFSSLTGALPPSVLDVYSPFSLSVDNKLCSAIDIQIAGNNLEIREVSIVYKNKRRKRR